MKKSSFTMLLILIALLGTGCFERFPAKYSETVELSVAVPSAGTLHVSTLNGAVSVRSGEVEEVQITAQKTVRSRTDEEAKRFCDETKIETEANASSASVSVVLPNDYRGRANIGVSMEAVVPKNCNLDLRTSNGSIEAREIDGGLQARTSNGRIEVHNMKGNVDLHTSNGRIVGEYIGGKAFADTSNGHIELVQVTGDVEALTSNAHVTIRDTGGDIRCRSSNSSIKLSNVVASADASTSNGSITCSLPVNASAAISGSASNGNIRSDFPLRIRHNTVSGKIGEGKHTIELGTTNGSVSIEKMP
jgi:DUF4097 and DUF4098 domain-containing protein YvlB